MPSADPAFANLLKVWEDSDCSYVPGEGPAKKHQCPRSAQHGPCWLLFIAVGPQPGRPRRWAHWQCLFWLLRMDEGSPWGKPGDWKSSVPACLCVHTYPLLPSSQPWLLVQAPVSLLLLDFHFPATLKGPLAPAYPARTCWSLLRHSSMFPHQFRGKNSTYWMAYSPPGRHTNRTENTEYSSAELAQAGAPESAGTLEPLLLPLKTQTSGCHGRLCLGWPRAMMRPLSLVLTADLAANWQAAMASKWSLVLLLQL